MNRFLNSHVVFLIFTYLLGVLLLQLFRLPIIFSNISYLEGIDHAIIYGAIFNLGLRFDSVYTCMLLLFPYVLLSIDFFFKKNTFLKPVTFYFIIVTFSISFIIAASDIPYFNYYNSRINVSVFSWTDDIPSMLGAMVSTSDYLLAFLMAAIAIVIFYFAFRYVYKRTIHTNRSEFKVSGKISITLILFVFLFFGYRGKTNINRHPLIPSDAYSTEYNIINQISLNGPQHFIYSLGSDASNFMDDEQAIHNVKNYLGVDSVCQYPIARKISFADSSSKPNIVLVLMESMSYTKLSWYSKKGLTPCLDRLIDSSLFFPNTYSAGIHTYNGIFSSIFSLPSVKRIKQTNSSAYLGANFAGFPNILKKHYYKNLFFTTGSFRFDNLDSFLPEKGFDYLISEEDYLKTHKRFTWGVGDHVMFDKAIEVYDSISKTTPFFSVLLTVSTHPPYEFPLTDSFVPNASTAVDRSYQYMDWSIGRFIDKASSKDWFENTIFVFVGDHGQCFDADYEIPLSYVHVPLLIYAPKFTEPKIMDEMSMQIDILPTVMGLAKLPYIHNTLGINLLEGERPYAYFCADEKIGCIDKEHLFILRKNGTSHMYEYTIKSNVDLSDSLQNKATEMQDYVFSMLQTTNYLVNFKLSGLPD